MEEIRYTYNIYTVIRLIFVVKIFSYAENIRNNFTLNFCYNEYLKQSTCVYAVFVPLWILEGYGWTHVYPSVLKADRQSTVPDLKGSLSTTIPSAIIASANREDRHLAEFGGHTPRYCTAYRRGNLSHSKPSPSLPC